jgi:hypothetical protein
MPEYHVLGWIEAPAHAPSALAEFDHTIEVVQGVQIRAADAAGQCLDQGLAGTWNRRRDLVTHQRAAAPYNSPHVPLPIFIVGAIMRAWRVDASLT